VSYAEVRKVHTTIGTTSSLSRTLAQFLDDVSSENYSTTAENGHSGNGMPIEDNNEAHESVSGFSMKLLSCCP
jgi:hypothetical protein